MRRIFNTINTIVVVLLFSCVDQQSDTSTIDDSIVLESNNSITGPQYKSEATRNVINKMLESHGGYQPWAKAQTVSYEHTFISSNDPNDLWTSQEIVEQNSRRVYQFWPLDTAELIYDGNGYYGVNWVRMYPKFTAHLAYYFSNLPWLTQDDGVILHKIKREKNAFVKEDTVLYYKIKMTFKQGTGESSKDFYVLYIDPKDFKLRAFEFTVAYGAILDLLNFPPELEFLGPLLKIYEDFEEVNGLIVPTRFYTLDSLGNNFGYHTVKDWSFDLPFDEQKMVVPGNAVLDTSSDVRKTQTLVQ